MHAWYLSFDGQQVGPLDLASAAARAKAQPNGLCWRAGFPEWIPIASCAELTSPAVPPPLGGVRTADVVDYTIHGEDMQFVEIELDPGESVVSEAGAMMYKDAVVQMETVFGDGSQAGEGGTFVDKLLTAGKRVVTGESLFTTVFSNQGAGKARVAFAAPYPGTILPLRLADYGGRIICQKDSFPAAARGASIGLYFQKRILTGLFGGEGVFFAEITGPGHVWAQSLPFSRLAGRMLMAAYQQGGARDEGSVLGGLGGLLSGDRRF
jgi:uncharacterized protein (AIM24 family)